MPQVQDQVMMQEKQQLPMPSTGCLMLDIFLAETSKEAPWDGLRGIGALPGAVCGFIDMDLDISLPSKGATYAGSGRDMGDADGFHGVVVANQLPRPVEHRPELLVGIGAVFDDAAADVGALMADLDAM
ncbi:hypothetical protein MKZ38_007134 [Zalerion maritima]|uniref:Uncharacterized protein n=1 Tax=Zalerion maritima TaxID=339359 RepID=A0AAD5WVK6_9PEZI|nr:hypothetical protein MKZ38_007134 [Zalerion maritima]